MKIMMSEGSKNKINTLEEFRNALKGSMDFYKQYYDILYTEIILKYLKIIK